MNVVTNLVQPKPESEQTKGMPQPEPDEIVEIEILNKRDHPYVPNKVADFEAVMREVQRRASAGQPPNP